MNSTVKPFDLLLRLLCGFMAAAFLLFLFDNYLIYWADWPGVRALFQGADDASDLKLAWLEAGIFLLVLAAIALALWRSRHRGLERDAQLYSSIAAYITRAAFWAIFLVGLCDMLISFLRVEGFLESLVGEHFAIQLGRSIFRGGFVHYPLIAAAFVIALFVRGLGFTWLALMIVAAEFLIVLTRFVFSYEQAFMGDLVRFWYAGLFLFASAYTLLQDGHVRVDVFYANFSHRGKALTNCLGSLLLGLPLCWNILIQGMSGKGSVINSPLLSFEISQSGFGMYTKYLMAGYLIIFATSMGIQFTGFILTNVVKYRDEPQQANETTVSAH